MEPLASQQKPHAKGFVVDDQNTKCLCEGGIVKPPVKPDRLTNGGRTKLSLELTQNPPAELHRPHSAWRLGAVRQEFSRTRELADVSRQPQTKDVRFGMSHESFGFKQHMRQSIAAVKERACLREPERSGRGPQ